MARTKEYVIKLAPIPWKRAGVSGKRFYDQQTHEKLAFGLYLNQQHGSEPKFTNPIQMEATFYLPLPKLVRKRKTILWSSGYPDIDNLAKFLLDAITNAGTIWKDDCIVSSLISKKIYDKDPRTHIVITELE